MGKVQEAITKQIRIKMESLPPHVRAGVGTHFLRLIGKACALLESEPEPGEFTKKCREVCKKGATHEQWEYATLLMEACDRIDRLSAKLKAKDEYLRKAVAMLVRYFNRYRNLYEYTPTETAKLITDIEQALKETTDGEEPNRSG